MSLSPLVYWAVAFVIFSLLGLFISAKTIKIDLKENGELIIAMLTILGTLVSVLLGLLVSSANDQYRSLEECVNRESTNVNQVFRLARGLPQPTASIVQNQCIEYCDKVLGEEWPAMKRGEMSEPVSKILARLSDEVVQFHPSNDGESNIQSAIITAATEVGNDRGVRIVASRSSWTHRMLPLIFTCAIVVLACSYLYAGKGSFRLHAVLVSLVAITLGTNIGVIFLMTRPFSSEWAIQPEGFELHLKTMKEFTNFPAHP